MDEFTLLDGCVAGWFSFFHALLGV